MLFVSVCSPMWMPLRKRPWFLCVSAVYVRAVGHICEFAMAVPIVDASAGDLV